MQSKNIIKDTNHYKNVPNHTRIGPGDEPSEDTNNLLELIGDWINDLQEVEKKVT
jgi:hypothetical protein